jgi:hypothetical protein
MIKLIILSLFAIFNSPDKCDTSVLADECVRQMPRKFSVLKTFPLARRKDQSYAECSYVFTKGTKYNIGACVNSKDNLKIEVFNSRRALVASAIGKKKYSKLAYKCVSSGIYYMRFSIESTPDICGATLLSFSKN